MHCKVAFVTAFGCLRASVAVAEHFPRLAAQGNCTGVNALSPDCSTVESAYHRDVFYVGGDYKTSGTTFIVSNQIYVEKLTPVSGVTKPYPLIFISAGVPSGSVWLNTPDNRQGWATYMLDKGYQVYILDITANGRSGQNDVAEYPTRYGSTVTIHENA